MSRKLTIFEFASIVIDSPLDSNTLQIFFFIISFCLGVAEVTHRPSSLYSPTSGIQTYLPTGNGLNG